MLLVNNLVGFGARQRPAAVIDYRTQTSSTANVTNSTYTFATQDIGAVSPLTRTIVVGVTTPGATSITGITVGGIAATSIFSSTIFDIYVAQVPTGTTANVVVTVTGTATSCHIAVWRLITETLPKLHDFDVYSDAAAGTTAVATIDVARGGVVLCYGFKIGSGGVALTNATERFDQADIGTLDYSGADYTNTGAAEAGRTITSTFTSATTRNLLALSYF